MDPAWLGAAIVLILISYFGRALRWQAMIRPIAPNARLWPLTEAQCIGFSAIVLFGRAGEFMRPYLIAKQENLSFSSQAAVWFLERLADLLMVLLIFGVALSQVGDLGATRTGPLMTWALANGGRLAAAIGAACVLLLFVFRTFPDGTRACVESLLDRLPRQLANRLRGFAKSFFDGLLAIRNDAALALVFLYTFIEWLLIIGCYYCLFQAFPPTRALGWTEVIVSVGFVSFGSIVQIPGIGGGMQVVMIVVLEQLFGIPLAEATGIAMLTWLITFVIIVPAGVVMALRRGINFRKMRELEDSPECAARSVDISKTR